MIQRTSEKKRFTAKKRMQILVARTKILNVLRSLTVRRVEN